MGGGGELVVPSSLAEKHVSALDIRQAWRRDPRENIHQLTAPEGSVWRVGFLEMEKEKLAEQQHFSSRETANSFFPWVVPEPRGRDARNRLLSGLKKATKLLA